MTFCRRALLWAIAAVLAVAAPNAHAANGGVRELSAELPQGVTLARASISQTAGALKTAVSKDPGNATSLLQTAVAAKTPKRGQGELPCKDLATLLRAAINGAPDQASKLTDTATSMRPDCADSLVDQRAGNDTGGAGNFGPSEDFGFGIGFGPGFPGSPGFVGSAPSGAFALPPVTTNPVTPATGS